MAESPQERSPGVFSRIGSWLSWGWGGPVLSGDEPTSETQREEASDEDHRETSRPTAGAHERDSPAVGETAQAEKSPSPSRNAKHLRGGREGGDGTGETQVCSEQTSEHCNPKTSVNRSNSYRRRSTPDFSEQMGRRRSGRRRRSSSGDVGGSQPKSPANTQPESPAITSLATSPQTACADSAFEEAENSVPECSGAQAPNSGSREDVVQAEWVKAHPSEDAADSQSSPDPALTSVADSDMDEEPVVRMTESAESKRRSIKVSHSEKFYAKKVVVTSDPTDEDRHARLKSTTDSKWQRSDERARCPEDRVDGTNVKASHQKGRIADKISLFERGPTKAVSSSTNMRHLDISPARNVAVRLTEHGRTRPVSALPNRTVKERAMNFNKGGEKLASSSAHALNEGQSKTAGHAEASCSGEPEVKPKPTDQTDSKSHNATQSKPALSESTSDSNIGNRELFCSVPTVSSPSDETPQVKSPNRTSSQSKKRRIKDTAQPLSPTSKNKQDMDQGKQEVKSNTAPNIPTTPLLDAGDVVNTTDQCLKSTSGEEVASKTPKAVSSNTDSKRLQKTPQMDTKGLKEMKRKERANRNDFEGSASQALNSQTENSSNEVNIERRGIGKNSDKQQPVQEGEQGEGRENRDTIVNTLFGESGKLDPSVTKDEKPPSPEDLKAANSKDSLAPANTSAASSKKKRKDSMRNRESETDMLVLPEKDTITCVHTAKNDPKSERPSKTNYKSKEKEDQSKKKYNVTEATETLKHSNEVNTIEGEITTKATKQGESKDTSDVKLNDGRPEETVYDQTKENDASTSGALATPNSLPKQNDVMDAIISPQIPLTEGGGPKRGGPSPQSQSESREEQKERRTASSKREQQEQKTQDKTKSKITSTENTSIVNGDLNSVGTEDQSVCPEQSGEKILSSSRKNTQMPPSNEKKKPSSLPPTANEASTSQSGQDSEKITATPASTNETVSTVLASTNEKATPLPASTNEKATPLPASTNEKATPPTASANGKDTPLPASVNEKATPLPPSANEKATPLPASTNEKATSLPASANEKATPLPASANEKATPLPASGNEKATPPTASANEKATPPTASANEKATPLPASGNEKATLLQPSANEKATPLPASTNEKATPPTASTNEKATSLPASANEKATPLPASANEKATPPTASANEKATSLPASGNEKATPLQPSANEKATPLPASTNEKATPPTASTNEKATPLPASANEKATTLPASDNEKAAPLQPSTNEKATPLPASTNEKATPPTASTNEKATPLPASANEKATTLPASTNEKPTPLPASANEKATPLPASANEKAAPLPASANEKATPLPASANEKATPLPASANEKATPLPASANEKAAPLPASANEKATPLPASANEKAAPLPASANEKATPPTASANEKATPLPASANEKATSPTASANEKARPLPASANEKATSPTASANEKATPPTASANEKATPLPASVNEKATPLTTSGKEKATPLTTSGNEKATPLTTSGNEKATPLTTSGNEKATPLTTSGKEKATPLTTSGNEKATPLTTSGKEKATPLTTSGNEKATPLTTSGNEKATPLTTSGNEKATPLTTSGNEKATPLTTSGNEKATPLPPSTNEKATPPTASANEKATPPTASANEKATPPTASANEKATPLPASANEKATPLPASTNEKATPLPPSTNKKATPLPASANEKATPLPASANEKATPLPASANEKATPLPASANEKATPLPASANEKATPLPPSANEKATPLPPSANENATPLPASANEKATPLPPSANDKATPLPASANEKTTPLPASDNEKTTPPPASTNETTSTLPASTNKKTTPAKPSTKEHAPPPATTDSPVSIDKTTKNERALPLPAASSFPLTSTNGENITPLPTSNDKTVLPPASIKENTMPPHASTKEKISHTLPSASEKAPSPSSKSTDPATRKKEFTPKPFFLPQIPSAPGSSSQNRDSPSSWLDVDHQRPLRKKQLISELKPKLSTSGSKTNRDTLGEFDPDDFIANVKRLAMPFNLPRRKHNQHRLQVPPPVLPAIREDRFEKPFDPEEFQHGLRKRREFILDLPPSSISKSPDTEDKKEDTKPKWTKPERESILTRSLIFQRSRKESKQEEEEKEEKMSDESTTEPLKTRSRLERCSIVSILRSSSKGRRVEFLSPTECPSDGLFSPADAPGSTPPSQSQLAPAAESPEQVMVEEVQAKSDGHFTPYGTQVILKHSKDVGPTMTPAPKTTSRDQTVTMVKDTKAPPSDTQSASQVVLKPTKEDGPVQAADLKTNSSDPQLTNSPPTPSGTQSSGTQSSGTQSSGTQSSGTQSSGTQSSGTQSSGTQSSGTQSSGTQSSGTQSSGTQSSGTQSSGTQSSGTQSSGTQSSGTQSSSQVVLKHTKNDGPTMTPDLKATSRDPTVTMLTDTNALLHPSGTQTTSQVVLKPTKDDGPTPTTSADTKAPPLSSSIQTGSDVVLQPDGPILMPDLKTTPVDPIATIITAPPPLPSFEDIKLPSLLEKFLQKKPETSQSSNKIDPPVARESAAIPGLVDLNTAVDVADRKTQEVTIPPAASQILPANPQRELPNIPAARGIHRRPAKIVIFELHQFNGQSFEFYRDQPDATQMQLSTVISVKVVRGCWILYEKPGFEGRCIALEEEGVTELPNQWAEEGEESSTPLVIGSIRLAVRDYTPPRIELFTEPTGRGRSSEYVDVTEEVGSFGLPHNTGSIKVHSGLWLVYSDPGFQGLLAVMEAGEYPFPEDWGFPAPMVGSLRPLRMGLPKVENPTSVKAVLYERAGLEGRCVEVQGDVFSFETDPDDHGLTCVESLKILGGLWVGFERKGFDGQQFLLEEGEYLDWRDWGGTGKKLLSLRPVLMDFSSPHMKMFSELDFSKRGVSIDLLEPLENVSDTHFGPHTGSIEVLAGVWVAFEEPGLSGRQYVLEKGLYGSPEDWGASDGRISSAVPVTLDNPEHSCHFQIQLFSEPGLDGTSVVLQDSLPTMPEGFSMRSCRVYAGSWLAFSSECFSGHQCVLEEGVYPDLRTMGFTQPNTSVLSIQPTGHEFSRPSVVLFERSGLKGRRTLLKSSSVNLQLTDSCTRVSSILVEGGMWVLYEASNFRGSQFLLKPGAVPDWPKLSSWQRIGSLRPLIQKQTLFRLRNEEAGLMMSVTGSLEDIKLMRIQVSEERGGANQIWAYHDGRLQCKWLPDCCVDVGSGVLMPGTRAVLSSEPGKPQQLWNISSDGIIRSNAAPHLVLEVKGGQQFDKSQIILNEFQPNKMNQRWSLEIL